jgi:flavin reductase (DIM6/NTAB) family NADH-FMN oxidoreductase RutF
MLHELPLAKVYQFIEPGPVALLTTQRPGHKPNVMTLSWHMMMEFEPPLIGCIVSGNNHSFATLEQTGEAVLAVPPASLAETVAAVGNCTGRDTDKFGVYPLTPLPAKLVGAPLVGEAIVSLECRVRDTTLAQTYNMFVLEVVRAWINPALAEAPTLHHHGYGTFVLDGETIKVKSKMR